MNLTEDDINNKPFPLLSVLSDSCYYPGCGTDGNPVAFLGRYCQSFIYIDHWVIREDFLNNIRRRPFTGYKTVAQRNLTPEELCPDLKGDYAVWLVVERKADKNDDFGPKRLSLLYIGADAIPTYQVIYQRNGIAPKILAIIQCNELLNNWGTGKGFKQLVLENPPQLMFTGHDGGLPVPRTPWRGYEERVFYINLSYECCFKRYDLWINRYFNRRTKYQNQINKGGDMLPMSKEMSELVDKVIDSIAKEQQELIQKKEEEILDRNNCANEGNFAVPERLNQKADAQIATEIENA
jgi:hypothetical protein